MDEKELEIILRSLRARIAGHQSKIFETTRIFEALTAIKLDDDGEKPIDPGTNAPISDARRTEIFDACIGTAKALLGQPLT